MSSRYVTPKFLWFPGCIVPLRCTPKLLKLMLEKNEILGDLKWTEVNDD